MAESLRKINDVMVRLFAYSNFSLVLSTALILSSNPFILRSYDGWGWLIGVILSTSLLYGLLSRKVITRYTQKPGAFLHSKWVLTGIFALPPFIWLPLNFGVNGFQSLLVLLFISISLIFSTITSGGLAVPSQTTSESPTPKSP